MISVVVPILINNEDNFNMTIKCLESAKKTKLAHHLIIVETESDHFKDYADIHVYEKKRTNATKSINRGFGLATGDYVVLLTNDVILDYGWLEALVECFDKKEDCGLSTLATTQLGHTKKDEISEGIWFSVAMMPKHMAMFDETYVNSWDDTDIIMDTYLSGLKMYRNYNVVVDHKVGATQYEKPDHRENFERNRKYFMKKYKDFKDSRIYKILTGGQVI